MDRQAFGATAELISRISDVGQLQQMLRNPAYAGYTSVIIARISEINRLRQAPQATQQPAPTVAQQALQGQPPPAQQAMAAGGIVAFRHGGKVRKFSDGGATDLGKYTRKSLAPEDTEQVFPTDHTGMEHAGATNQKFPSALDVAIAQQRQQDAIARARIQAYDQAQQTAPTSPAAPAQQPTQPAAPAVTAPAINPKDYNLDAQGNLVAGGVRGMRTPDYSRVQSIADYKKELQQGNEDTANLAADRQSILQSQQQTPGMALMQAGLGMARDASVNPRAGLLGNAAAGGIGGLNYYTQQSDQQAAQLRDLNKVARQENQALNMAAVRERGEDVRTAMASQAQSAMAKAYMSKGFLDEQDIRGYAQYLAGKDRAAGLPVQAPAYYIMQAKEHANGISSGMQIAGVNNAARATTASQNGWLKYQQTNGPVPFERYQQMITAGQPNAVAAETSGSAPSGGGTILGTYPGAQ